MVVLGVAVLACSMVAPKLRLPAPVLLLAAGALLGFVPALRRVSLPPEVVLLLFLPALLYWESLTTSLREIRSNLRPIILLSTGLVIATAAAVAAAAHHLGLPWGPAWVLGAAVAPTDATVVGIVTRMLPRRTVTVLRAESLVNDGTALVIYGLAVGITVGEDHFGVPHVAALFAVAYVGGAVAGLVSAWLAVQARRRLDDPLLENVVSILTPFVAFLAAELVHASGVLAVVVCGLALSQVGPRLVKPDTRQQARAFWTLSTFTLNASLFVLVGLKAAASARDLTTFTTAKALVAVGVLAAVVIGTRAVWEFTTPYIIRALDRRPQQRLRRMGARGRVVITLCGFRGAVSLAAALAVPKTLDSGAPFPDRDVIVFVTSGVIVVTLVLQSLLLPATVRWARLPEDTTVAEERRLAETEATETAMRAIPDLASRLGTHETALARTQLEYETHLRLLTSDGDVPEIDAVRRAEEDYAALRLELLALKRATVVRLRDERRIDDTVLRQIQARLDVEELRLAQREVID